MKFLNSEEIKNLEEKYPLQRKKLGSKAVILGGVLAVVLIVLAPIMKDYALFVGLTLGFALAFVSYNTMLYEAFLEKENQKLKEHDNDKTSKGEKSE